MALKITAYALALIAIILNFSAPTLVRKLTKADQAEERKVMRVKISALVLAVAAMLILLIFDR